MKDWPPDERPVPLSVLLVPLRDTLDEILGKRQIQTRKYQNEQIHYDGYDGSEDYQKQNPPTKDLFTDESLKKFQAEGKDPLDVLLFLALNVGIEQGRRIQRAETKKEQDET